MGNGLARVVVGGIVISGLGGACRHDPPAGRPPTVVGADASDSSDALAASDAGALEAGADRAPSPKNPACAEPTLGVTRTVLTEGFESHQVNQFPGEPWVEANAGRTAIVTDSWTRSGQRAFVVQSFLSPGQPEIVYAPLSVARTPARLTLTFYLAPNAFISYRAFASVSFGEVRSRFDVERHVGVQLVDHTLSFQGSRDGAMQPVWNEVAFASSAFRDSPPAVYNYIRGELDFCTGTARWYVGPDAQAPLRATLSFDAAVPIGAIVITGGVNDSVIDDLVVEAFGVLD